MFQHGKGIDSRSKVTVVLSKIEFHESFMKQFFHGASTHKQHQSLLFKKDVQKRFPKKFWNNKHWKNVFEELCKSKVQKWLS